VNTEATKLTDGQGKNRVLFFGKEVAGTAVGHWVYCTAKGKEWNSYEKGHQKSGSHQFCQSFAQIYMLADLVGDKESGTTLLQSNNGNANIPFEMYVMFPLRPPFIGDFPLPCLVTREEKWERPGCSTMPLNETVLLLVKTR